MPKTRKKRGGKSEKQKKEGSKLESDLMTNQEIYTTINDNGTIIETEKNFENLSDGELRTELQLELKRLQDEYRHQKQLTADLERKRDTVQLEVAGDDSKSLSASDLNIGSDLEPKATGIADIYIDQPFEQPYLSDIDIDKRISSNIDVIKNELLELKELIDSKVDKEILNEYNSTQLKIDDLSNNVSLFSKELQRVQKDISKTDEKLNDVLMDLGFEESIEINKIPNFILVLVYESILNDLINRIRHILGPQDTESAVQKILEGVRSHTSGGELFKFDHNRIKIPELKQYLDKKMISPKQIHITFKAIVDRLVEYTPGYQPKNFKAMIKIKSQEYSVDMTVKLEERIDNLGLEMEEIKKNINKFLSKYKDRMVSQQMYQEEMKNLHIHVSRITAQIDELPMKIEKTLEEKLEEKLKSKLEEKPSTKPDKKVKKEKKEIRETKDKKDVKEETKVTGEGEIEEPEGKSDLDELTLGKTSQDSQDNQSIQTDDGIIDNEKSIEPVEEKKPPDQEELKSSEEEGGEKSSDLKQGWKEVISKEIEKPDTEKESVEENIEKEKTELEKESDLDEPEKEITNGIKITGGIITIEGKPENSDEPEEVPGKEIQVEESIAASDKEDEKDKDKKGKKK